MSKEIEKQPDFKIGDYVIIQKASYTIEKDYEWGRNGLDEFAGRGHGNLKGIIVGKYYCPKGFIWHVLYDRDAIVGNFSTTQRDDDLVLDKERNRDAKIRCVTDELSSDYFIYYCKHTYKSATFYFKKTWLKEEWNFGFDLESVRDSIDQYHKNDVRFLVNSVIESDGDHKSNIEIQRLHSSDKGDKGWIDVPQKVYRNYTTPLEIDTTGTDAFNITPI